MIIKTKNKVLTVLHVATLNKPITSDLGYAPVETIIHNIHKGLQMTGHRSIVACSTDSRITGEHYATVNQSLGEYCFQDASMKRDVVARHLSRVLERVKMGDIDVIHMHEWSEYVYNGTFSPPVPIVMTHHVPANVSIFNIITRRLRHVMPESSLYHVAISEYQRRDYDGIVNICKTVHHGVEVEEFPFNEKSDKGHYLFHIGRVTRVKGQDTAIQVARQTGSKLIMAGCVQTKPEDKAFFESLKGSIDFCVDLGKHPVGKDYYDKVMKPLLDCDTQIIYIGELDSEQKKEWFRYARATLFPIQWGEPFGLVMIESMACGTPILAFRKGAAPEIVVDGKTGCVVDSLSEMIRAVDRIDRLEPRECRRHVQEHFSTISMATKYSELYQQIVDGSQDNAAAADLLVDPLLIPVLPGVQAA